MLGMPRQSTLCTWRRVLPYVVAVLLAVLPAGSAHAWGFAGHRHIAERAVDHLPLPLRGFFAANRSDIGNLSGDEPPGKHYIDIDVYPEFFAGTFPRNLNDLVARYGWTKVNDVGRGPWTWVDYLEDLTQAMAAARTPADWQDLLPVAGAAAHYIEDLHNPLHLTENYDGQLSGNSGIHSRYESTMISRNLSNLTIQPAAAAYIASPVDFVFDGIDEHYWYVDDIMAADDAAPRPFGTAYYNSLWAQTGAFTRTLFQDASVAVASTWYTAWIDAGSPRTFLESPTDFDANSQVDGADLDVWSAAYASTSVADANRNGVTDGGDFLLWQRQLGAGSSVAATSPVPEPTTATLVFAASISVALWRRFRVSARLG
jgi:hypothetical protein